MNDWSPLWKFLLASFVYTIGDLYALITVELLCEPSLLVFRTVLTIALVQHPEECPTINALRSSSYKFDGACTVQPSPCMRLSQKFWPGLPCDQWAFRSATLQGMLQGKLWDASQGIPRSTTEYLWLDVLLGLAQEFHSHSFWCLTRMIHAVI